MRTIALLLFLAAESVAWTGEPEFRLLAEAWRTAYNSADSAGLASMYAPEAQYVSGHVAGLVAEGRDRVVSNFLRGIRMGGHIDSLQVLSVQVSGDLAVVYCRYAANNAGQQANGRNVLVVRRIGERWLINLHMTVV